MKRRGCSSRSEWTADDRRGDHADLVDTDIRRGHTDQPATQMSCRLPMVTDGVTFLRIALGDIRIEANLPSCDRSRSVTRRRNARRLAEVSWA